MKEFILMSILLTSCLSQGARSYRGFFEADLTSHFPQDSDSHRISSSYFFPTHESYGNLGVYIRESYKFPAYSIDTLQKSLEATALYKMKHNDTSSVYVELYFNHGLNLNGNGNQAIPLPNFWEEIIALGFQEGNYLPQDFDLFVIESETGRHIEEKYLNDKEDLFGSKKWKNGISKGVAISAKRGICIYWLEIW